MRGDVPATFGEATFQSSPQKGRGIEGWNLSAPKPRKGEIAQRRASELVRAALRTQNKNNARCKCAIEDTLHDRESVPAIASLQDAPCFRRFRRVAPYAGQFRPVGARSGAPPPQGEVTPFRRGAFLFRNTKRLPPHGVMFVPHFMRIPRASRRKTGRKNPVRGNEFSVFRRERFMFS